MKNNRDKIIKICDELEYDKKLPFIIIIKLNPQKTF